MRAFVTTAVLVAATPATAFQAAPAGRGRARRGPTQRAFRARATLSKSPVWVREAQRVPVSKRRRRRGTRATWR